MTDEYFVDYDERVGLWCVFHIDNRAFAVSTWWLETDAKLDAEKRNGKNHLTRKVRT